MGRAIPLSRNFFSILDLKMANLGVFWALLFTVQLNRFKRKRQCCAPLKGFPWNWVPVLGIKRTRLMGQPDEERSLTIFSRLGTIHERDRRTDGHPTTVYMTLFTAGHGLCKQTFIIIISIIITHSVARYKKYCETSLLGLAYKQNNWWMCSI